MSAVQSNFEFRPRAFSVILCAMDSPAAGCLRVAVFLLSAAAGLSHARENINDARRAAAAELFSNGLPVQINIQISDEDVKALKKDSRKYVRATLIEGELVYTNVGLHLKGSAGSFRQIDDPKPPFTLSFNQFNLEQRFHGLRKIHLNNSVQDGSYLNELLAGALF